MKKILIIVCCLYFFTNIVNSEVFAGFGVSLNGTHSLSVPNTGVGVEVDTKAGVSYYIDYYFDKKEEIVDEQNIKSDSLISLQLKPKFQYGIGLNFAHEVELDTSPSNISFNSLYFIIKYNIIKEDEINNPYYILKFGNSNKFEANDYYSRDYHPTYGYYYYNLDPESYFAIGYGTPVKDNKYYEILFENNTGKITDPYYVGEVDVDYDRITFNIVSTF